MIKYEYESVDQSSGVAVVLCVVSVAASCVLIDEPCPHFNDPMPPVVAKTFIDACFEVDNLPAGDYSAVVQKFPESHQPWPVFVFQNWHGGDCVGEFYPKNFESQTIEI